MQSSLVMKTTKQPTVTMSKSDYNNPLPMLTIFFPEGTHHRKISAALHTLAAQIELATNISERWCVETRLGFNQGSIVLELCEASKEEAARGIALLTKFAR